MHCRHSVLVYSSLSVWPVGSELREICIYKHTFWEYIGEILRNISKIKIWKWPDSTYIHIQHFIISVILLWLLFLKSQSVHTTTDTTIYYLWLISSAQIILQLQPQNGIALREKHHYYLILFLMCEFILSSSRVLAPPLSSLSCLFFN